MTSHLDYILNGTTYCLHCGGWEPGVSMKGPRDASCEDCANLEMDMDDQLAVENVVMVMIGGHADTTMKRHPQRGPYLSIKARNIGGREELLIDAYADRPPLCAALIMATQAMNWYRENYIPPYGGGGGTTWAGGFAWVPNYKEWKG